jgi:DNA-binding transcriptional LysR family regulator
VARYGSVAAAARALSFSGPAVSQQLAALERETGVRLLERAGRGVRLTAAARILVDHTDALLSQLEAAEADLAALRETVSGRVRVAAFPSAAATLLPRAWSRLRDSAPHVELDLVEMEPDESVPLVLRGELDVAVAHEYDVLPRVLDPLFERRDLLADPVLVALPERHDLAGADGIDLRALAASDFVTPRPPGPCAEMAQRVCGAAGFVPRVVARANDFQVLLNLVAAGVGVALVPRLAAGRVPEGARLVPPRQVVTRSVFALSRRGGHRMPAVRLLLDELSQVAAGPGA